MKSACWCDEAGVGDGNDPKVPAEARGAKVQSGKGAAGRPQGGSAADTHASTTCGGNWEGGPWAGGSSALWRCLFRKLQSQTFQRVFQMKGGTHGTHGPWRVRETALQARSLPVVSLPPGGSVGPSGMCSCRGGAQGWQGRGRRPRLLEPESGSLRLTQATHPTACGYCGPHPS